MNIFTKQQTSEGDYRIDFQLKMYFNSIYHDAKNAFYSFVFAVVNLMLNLMRVGRR